MEKGTLRGKKGTLRGKKGTIRVKNKIVGKGPC